MHSVLFCSSVIKLTKPLKMGEALPTQCHISIAVHKLIIASITLWIDWSGSKAIALFPPTFPWPFITRTLFPEIKEILVKCVAFACFYRPFKSSGKFIRIMPIAYVVLKLLRTLSRFFNIPQLAAPACRLLQRWDRFQSFAKFPFPQSHIGLSIVGLDRFGILGSPHSQ